MTNRRPGIIFYDEELEWCRTIGWGVECGITIVHYTSVTDLSHEEHHSSLTEMLAMMTQSPHPSVIPDYQLSRVLCRSEMLQKALFTDLQGTPCCSEVTSLLTQVRLGN
jgi:hypothetical protein